MLRLLLTLALVTAGASHARGDDGDDIAAAKRHFAQAEAYFKAGTYDKAIPEYQAAYDLVPRPALLFNLGLCHENLGDAERAVTLYSRYLEAAPGGVKATEARARREALQRALADKKTKSERAARAGELRRRAAEASAAGDHDAAVAALAEARPLSNDPEILFEMAEAHRARGDTALALTEYRRYLAATDTGAHREEAGRRIDELETARTRRAAEPTPEPAGKPTPRPEKRSRAPLIGAIVAYGAGAVLFGAGAVYGSRANSTLAEIDDELASGNPPLDSGDPRFDDGRNDARSANLAFALGGACLAAGAALTVWALWPQSSADDRPRAAIAPYAGPGQAGAALEVIW